MKEKYERTDLDVTLFRTEDVIITSGEAADPYEDEILNPNR